MHGLLLTWTATCSAPGALPLNTAMILQVHTIILHASLLAKLLAVGMMASGGAAGVELGHIYRHIFVQLLRRVLYLFCQIKRFVSEAHVHCRERKQRLRRQDYRLDISFLLQEGVLSDADWAGLPSQVKGVHGAPAV